MTDFVKVIPFEPEHYGMLKLREFDMQAVMGHYDLEAALRMCGNGNAAFTGFMGNRIVASGGMVKLWQGVAEAWMLTTELVKISPLNFHEIITEKMFEMIQGMGLHRLQCTVHAEHTKSIRWIERLGFSREGLMKNYGADGSDYYLYARTGGK